MSITTIGAFVQHIEPDIAIKATICCNGMLQQIVIMDTDDYRSALIGLLRKSS